jgi:ABC-type branched-subunit amino acid transport system substrate-binding protein
VSRMKWTSRRCAAAAAAVAAAVGVAACGSSNSGGSGGGGGGGGVTFGQIQDFTGVGAAVAPYSNASELSAIYTINAGGGINGQKVANNPIDTKSDPADAVISINKALATSHLNATNGPNSDTAAAVVPILERSKVIVLCGCGNPQYDRNTNPYFWRVIPPDPVGGETMSLYAHQLGYTRVAAVFGTDSGSQGDLPGVMAGVKAAHLQLVANIGLTPDQTSYRSQVEQLIAAKPEVIFTESDGQTAAAFFGELKQLGQLVPIFGTNATLQTNYLKALSAAIGISDLKKYYQAQAPATSSATAGESKAVNEYNTAVRHVGAHLASPLGQWLNNSFVEGAYSGVIMVALAMDAAHSSNPTPANNYVMKVTARGSGKTVVYTYADGVAALKAHKQIQYIGAGGPILFDQWHNSFGDQAMQKVTVDGTVLSSKNFPAAEIQRLG